MTAPAHTNQDRSRRALQRFQLEKRFQNFGFVRPSTTNDEHCIFGNFSGPGRLFRLGQILELNPQSVPVRAIFQLGHDLERLALF